MKSIQYVIAKNQEGSLVHVREAQKGNKFYCPSCLGEFILRKSGNTGKGSKRPHFAHNSLTTDCTPETALHFIFKMQLAEKIADLIKIGEPLNFSWECEYCSDAHSGDLLKKVRLVEVEYNLGKYRPDIALLDKNQDVIAVIEIVVTHEPEQDAIDFYDANNIVLIQIDLSSDQDIDILDQKIERPTRVNFCNNSRCKSCRAFKASRTLQVNEGSCWRCHKNMRIAFTIPGKDGTYGDPSEFSNDVVELARKKGVFLQMRYSKTMKQKYLANICPQCNAFAGKNLLFTDYISAASSAKKLYQVKAEYYCSKCESSDG